MNLTPPDGAEADSCDPVALNFAASKLEVYEHERLAYTEIPARRPKPKRSIARRMKRFFQAIYFWAIARG